MNVLDFKTNTMIQAKINPSLEGKWLLGIDIGYSGCKIFSQNKVALFPCYAKKINGEILNISSSDNDIWYQDAETHEIWAVGETAIGMMGSQDTNDNVGSMYSRSRYNDPMFLVLMRVGMGIGLLNNAFGTSTGKELFVETGLPAAYMADDYQIKESFCGNHEFAIKVGNGKWEKFSFSLDENHVFVTSQPKGTLYSSIIDETGNFIPESTKMLKSRTLIFDAGFNTLDLVMNLNGSIDSNTTSYNNLAMKQVFIDTAEEVFKKYHERIEIPYMQKILGDGIINSYDRKTHSTTEIEIADILFMHNKDVCYQAIDKIRSMYNDLRDFDYIVVTGGTGEAWWSIINDDLRGMRSLTVLPGNHNSDLPFTFSNVRGYYFFLYRYVKKRGKNS